MYVKICLILDSPISSNDSDNTDDNGPVSSNIFKSITLSTKLSNMSMETTNQNQSTYQDARYHLLQIK